VIGVVKPPASYSPLAHLSFSRPEGWHSPILSRRQGGVTYGGEGCILLHSGSEVLNWHFIVDDRGRKSIRGVNPNLPPPSWSTLRLAGVHTQSDWIQYSDEATDERKSSEMTNLYCGHKLYSNHSDSCCWRYLLSLSLSLSLDVGRKKDHEYCSCCCRILHTMNEKAIRRSRIVVSPAHTHTLLPVIRLLSKLVSLTSARAIWDHVLELLTLSPATWSSPKDSVAAIQ